jgi:hypothetical protein
MGEPTVTVTPWNTRPTQERPNGQYHDCLWEMAQEQAALDRMQRYGEDFKTARQKTTPEEHLKHLDTLCDDNGFRRLYGGGSGRDPNLVLDGEKIKVRIDPTKLTEPAPGVSDPKTGPAYTKAVQSDTGGGPDLKKKEKLDAWLNAMTGFKDLPADIKGAWIDTYAREGVDATKLSKLAGTEAFKNLDDATKIRLLRLYGQKDQGIVTAQIDKLLAAPGQEDKNRLVLMATPGFARLEPAQQKRLFERYDSDGSFKQAINQIVTQGNFNDKSEIAQAHALDLLYRYAGRKGSGYGLQLDRDHKLILVRLYNDVLSKPEFNLEANGGSKPENGDQAGLIDHFAQKKAPYIDDRPKR